jgi:hypothetical protein
MRTDKAAEVRDYLIQMVDLFHRRFIIGPSIENRQFAAPDGADSPWFDTKIEGLTKLNCFIHVPASLYNRIKKVNWAPVTGNPTGVICDGPATPASLEMIGIVPINTSDERYEAALYEKPGVKPPIVNLELKIVSLATKQVNAPRRGLVDVPAEQFIVNAHIICD